MNENKAVKLWKIEVLNYDIVKSFFIRNGFTELEFSSIIYNRCQYFICDFDTVKKIEDIFEYIAITPMDEKLVRL